MIEVDSAKGVAGGLCARLPVEGDDSNRSTSGGPDHTIGLRGCHFARVLSDCLFRKSGFACDSPSSLMGSLWFQRPGRVTVSHISAYAIAAGLE
jgi:hypothetical protein